MTKGYVESGWSRNEILEAVEMLNTCQTVYLFKGEYWDHRMLRDAVESGVTRLEEEVYANKRMQDGRAESDS